MMKIFSLLAVVIYCNIQETGKEYLFAPSIYLVDYWLYCKQYTFFYAIFLSGKCQVEQIICV